MKFENRTLKDLETMFLAVMKKASKIQMKAYVSGRLFNTISQTLYGTKLLSSINKRFGVDGKENGFTVLRRKYNYPYLVAKYSREQVLECYYLVFKQVQKQPTEQEVIDWGGPKLDVVYRIFGTHL